MGEIAAFLLVLVLVCACWQKVEGKRGYSYSDCISVEGDSSHSYSGSRCFCYSPGTGIKWKDIWSTFKVNVTSSEDVFVTFPLETSNCHHPDDLLTVTNCFVEHYWPSAIQKEKTLHIPLVEEDVCFMTRSPRSNSEYTLHVSNKRLNRNCFLLFFFGLVLYFGAGAICRSSVFFYITGVLLGVIATSVFLTIIFRNFIPKRGLFLVLLGAGSSLSYIGIQKVFNKWDDIIAEHWMELLVYLLVSGSCSVVVLYRHGGISSRRALGLMTWCVQTVAVLMLHNGITFPPAFYVLLACLLSWKTLPLLWALLTGVWSVLCFFVGFVKTKSIPKRRLLTEEEYREQGEMQTKASLEQLREHCNQPDFPAWETVLRLRSPKKFAEFLQNGCHVSQEEVEGHENQYGLGGLYHENMLFNNSSDAELQREEGDDSSGDELITHCPPTLNDLQCPDEYTPTSCPYPTYSPQPEPVDPDQDFF